MNQKNTIGLAVLVLTTIGFSMMFADAAISSILMGGQVVVTDLEGTVQYTSNPFTDWTPTINIQAGAIWRTRLENLTMDYTGNVNVTWTLFDAGADSIIGTGDDSVVPGATFLQPIVIVANTPINVTASIDGFNPYNWGQWTSTPMVVYVQAEVTEG